MKQDWIAKLLKEGDDLAFYLRWPRQERSASVANRTGPAIESAGIIRSGSFVYSYFVFRVLFNIFEEAL